MKPVTNQSSASPGHAHYVLGVLFVVYVFNFLDRQLLSVFIGPIKQEFGVSDTAVGLLVSFAFALLYTFAAIFSELTLLALSCDGLFLADDH